MRNPEGVWGWLEKKRNDLGKLGMHFDNRAIYNYFKERIVVKSHKLGGVIRKPCLTIEFVGGLEESARDIFRVADVPVF